MTVYSSSFRCNSTFLEALKALIKQAYEYRWQVWLTIKKRIQSTYQQDVLGVFWSIVMPLIPMTVYMVLAQIKVFKTVEDMPFIYYIAAGMFVWLLMAKTIHTIVLAIKAEKAILTTTTFPIFPTLLSRLGEVLHDSAIRLVVLGIILLWFHIDTSFSNIVLFILSLIPVAIFALGLGMILAILDLVVQDTRRVVLLALRYGLFLSSVIFPFPETGIAAEINKFNFFNTFVNASRDILYYGTVDNWTLYIVTCLAGVAIFILAAKLVYSMEFKVREYL